MLTKAWAANVMARSKGSMFARSRRKAMAMRRTGRGARLALARADSFAALIRFGHRLRGVDHDQVGAESAVSFRTAHDHDRPELGRR